MKMKTVFLTLTLMLAAAAWAAASQDPGPAAPAAPVVANETPGNVPAPDDPALEKRIKRLEAEIKKMHAQFSELRKGVEKKFAAVKKNAEQERAALKKRAVAEDRAAKRKAALQKRAEARKKIASKREDDKKAQPGVKRGRSPKEKAAPGKGRRPVQAQRIDTLRKQRGAKDKRPGARGRAARRQGEGARVRGLQRGAKDRSPEARRGKGRRQGEGARVMGLQRGAKDRSPGARRGAARPQGDGARFKEFQKAHPEMAERLRENPEARKKLMEKISRAHKPQQPDSRRPVRDAIRKKVQQRAQRADSPRRTEGRVREAQKNPRARRADSPRRPAGRMRPEGEKAFPLPEPIGKDERNAAMRRELEELRTIKKLLDQHPELKQRLLRMKERTRPETPPVRD